MIWGELVCFNSKKSKVQIVNGWKIKIWMTFYLHWYEMYKDESKSVSVFFDMWVFDIWWGFDFPFLIGP